MFVTTGIWLLISYLLWEMWGYHGSNCEGYCLLGYMMWPPPCHWCSLVGFPLCVLEYCIPLGTWIHVYRSCYLCCHHLWAATVLVWFTKTCNLLFSAVDVYMLKCCLKWNSHPTSSKVCGGVKFLCFPKPLQFCGQWVLCIYRAWCDCCVA